MRLRFALIVLSAFILASNSNGDIVFGEIKGLRIPLFAKDTGNVICWFRCPEVKQSYQKVGFFKVPHPERSFTDPVFELFSIETLEMHRPEITTFFQKILKQKHTGVIRIKSQSCELFSSRLKSDIIYFISNETD